MSQPPPQSQPAEHAPASQARPGSLWKRRAAARPAGSARPFLLGRARGAVQVLRGWRRKSSGLWKVERRQVHPPGGHRCAGARGGSVPARPAGHCPSLARPSPAWGSQSKYKAGDGEERVKGGSAKMQWKHYKGKTEATRVLSLVGVCQAPLRIPRRFDSPSNPGRCERFT